MFDIFLKSGMIPSCTERCIFVHAKWLALKFEIVSETLVFTKVDLGDKIE